jgi:hypothetical protein
MEKSGTQDLQAVESSLKHPGTGRSAAVLRVQDFEGTSPVAVAAGKYILVIASMRNTVPLGVKTARAWINAGASYICAWGPDSAAVEETFDYAGFLPECGDPLPFTLMTTSHREKTPEEALWFAFYCATSPDDLRHELKTVVILVDSDALWSACTSWVKENRD